ncbi:unnamed protein product [Allacma fusca]|uniref:MHD domain-containing protein n=1 Tax=Allacma fusca TaxID=39272 RepID=A0A8J2PBM5_9HEXA|nr:unnamed protein product [Allacma fusca]
MGRQVENVSVEIPMPKSVLNCSLTASQGKYSFDPVSKVMLWEVGKIDPTKLPNIRGTINMQAGSPQIESNPTANVNFMINQMAVSGIKVSRLDMYGEKYRPFKGVKYITKAGKFQFSLCRYEDGVTIPASQPGPRIDVRTISLYIKSNSVYGQFQFQQQSPFNFQNQSFFTENRPEIYSKNKSIVNYIVLAPSIIHPASVYTAVVTVRKATVPSLQVTVSLSKDGVDLHGSSSSMQAPDSQSFRILVPRQLTHGTYKVRVEGNYPNTQGGSIFLHESNLKFSERFLSILIQTNRYVFNGGQKVKFRAVLLKRDLRPFEDSADIYILDARDIIMRRWLSVSNNQGVIDLMYELPEYSNLGKWKIQVHADTQVEEKVIQVEKYFQPQFEVFVSLPSFILASEKSITASVSGFYGTEKTVRGNATVRLYAFQYNDPRNIYTFIDAETLFVTGEEEVTWDISAVYDVVGTPPDLGIRIEADIKEYFIGETRLGFAESRIIAETYNLKFVNSGPPIFKPGLSFVTHLRVMFSDLERIPTEKLQNSVLRVLSTAVTVSGESINLAPIEVFPSNQERNEIDRLAFDSYLSNPSQYLELSRLRSFWDNGVLQIRVTPPKRASRLVFQAEFTDEDGVQVRTSMTANSVFSPTRRYLNVWTTSSRVVVGEYVTLHVAATYHLKEFHYVVMGKGLILQSGTEHLADKWSLPKSFSVVVSSEMSPGFRVLVYHITANDEIVSDSVFIPVDIISRHTMNLNLNQHKDRSKDTLEVQMLGDPGAYFGVSAQRSVRQFMQAGNEFSASSVFSSLYSLEPSNSSIHVVTWRDRSGEKPDQSLYLPSMNYGANAAKTFLLSNLLAFSDGLLPGVEDSVCEEGKLPCSTVGCYSLEEKCDKITHCTDGTDEFDCEALLDEDLVAFRVDRISRFMDFYDPSDGDWGWSHQNIAHGGDYISTLSAPKITDTWHFNGFAVSKKNGFALLESDIVYETIRPFMLIVDAPPAVRRGEQFGVIAMLYNKTPKDIYVVVELKASDDFVFVNVGREGMMDFSDGSPPYATGDHHHFVWIPANSEVEVRVPIKPIIEQGSITIQLSATTQIRQDSAEIEVEVQPEGVQLGKHTSLLLDLKNRAQVIKFMDIFTEESPLIPYDQRRKFVYGSPAGHVTISGDIMGPIFPKTPVTMGELLGRNGKGTADRLFDLSANVWQLHYLRLTNQLETPFARVVFEEMNKFFAHVMKRYSTVGWFKMWNLSKPSVWLSAWALQIFHHASFPDWESYFYVEKRVFSSVTQWLLKHQNFDGSFSETQWFTLPLNKKMGFRKDVNGPMNVTLTAHMAITLHHVLGSLEGRLRVLASVAKNRAIQYLESTLISMSDPYQVAITAYALTLTDSQSKEAAFDTLNKIKIDEGGMVYWSPGKVPENAIVHENSRPFIQPKNNEFWDSVAVEATSFALLTYLIRDGITAIPEKAVAWLNTMRLTDGGFISTLDTAVAFEALTEYSNRARLRDITDMTVTVEFASQSEEDELSQIWSINPNNIITVQSFDIPQVWGHVNVIAKGAGQAVIQLDTSFGVDREEFKDTPPEDCFDLRVREFFSTERNKSILTLESCFRWTLLDESDVSATAVLEVEIPSGYGLLQSDAISLVASGVHPTLKDALAAPGKTSWYFDYITPEWTCFNHTVRRWYPVANLTAYKQATIYEAYAPERFVNYMFNDTSNLHLSMCHVCGSYQCPYCPFFSDSATVKAGPRVAW